MVVGDELQRVGDAVDEVLLADGGHGAALLNEGGLSEGGLPASING
jgi:hypothetical protein